MGKCFRFLGCLGLASMCNVSYGTPYPSLKDIEAKLEVPGGIGAVVEKVFKDVYQQAEASSFKKSGFKNLKLIGEGNGSLTLPRGLGVRYYRPQDYRDWQWKFDTVYGFFSCTVNSISVFDGVTTQEAVEASERDRLKRLLTRCGTEKIAEITKVCRVLLSEEFAKRFLGEPLLQALYDNKDAAYSCFDVEFSPRGKNIFRFDVMYSQTVKEKEREAKGASVFAVRFHFKYNLEKHDFFDGEMWDEVKKCCVQHRPQYDYLGVNGMAYSSCLGLNDHAMARVWKHPYGWSRVYTGKEKLSGKKNTVFEEKRQEDLKDKGKTIGLEEDEEDLRVHTGGIKKDKTRKRFESNGYPGLLQSKGARPIACERSEDMSFQFLLTGERGEKGTQPEEILEHSEDVKKDKARKGCVVNKHPRSHDWEDEKSEGNFKKKKE